MPAQANASQSERLHTKPSLPSALAVVLCICEDSCSAHHIAAQALMPGWFFGIRQQDAAEYVALLLRHLTQEAWQSQLQREGVHDNHP